MELQIFNNRVKDLYNTISKDLMIEKFKVENDNEFHYRLIYSAISRRALRTFSDRDFEESEIVNLKQVSKKHCTLTCLNVLESFIELDKNLENYFKDEKNRLHFINNIQDMYITLGYINNGKYFFNEQKYKARIDFISRDLIIDCQTNNKRTRGIGVWGKSREEHISLNDYLISKINAHDYALKMINYLNFIEFNQEEGLIEFYNFKFNKWVLYEPSIIDNYKYGILKIDKGLDYKIIKKTGDKIYASSLPKIYNINNDDLIFKHEVWRIILGLCSVNEMPAKCEILINKNDAIIITFHGFILPQLEKSLLKCMAWPTNSCNGIAEFITDSNMLSAVKQIISNLSIEIKEEYLNE